MSAKLGSRKARLGLMRLGAPSSTPFLADLPSSLELEDRTAVLALDDRASNIDLAGPRNLVLSQHGSQASLEEHNTTLATEQRGSRLHPADDQRRLDLDG